jgi:hypothetical protein
VYYTIDYTVDPLRFSSDCSSCNSPALNGKMIKGVARVLPSIEPDPNRDATAVLASNLRTHYQLWSFALWVDVFKWHSIVFEA